MSIYSQLSQIYKNVARVWYNKLKISSALDSDLDWVVENKDSIDNIISSYTNIGTQKCHYTAAAKIAELKGLTDLNLHYKKIYSKLSSAITEKNNDNTLNSGREDAVNMYDIISARCYVEKLFTEDPSVQNNLQYLLLCMYTMQPSARTVYKDMKIIKSSTEDNKIDNFLLVSRGKTYVIINSDKKSDPTDSSKYNPAKFCMPPELNKIIKNSLNIYNRDYLFTPINDPKSPMTYQQYVFLLYNIFKSTSKKVNFDILRSAYITDFYSKNPSMKDKNLLAVKMRHSVKAATDFYNKTEVNSTIDCNVSTNLNEKGVPQIKNGTFDMKVWRKEYAKKKPEVFREGSKKYYEKNKYDVLRKKILRNIANGNVDKPSQSSITKYNLIYNEHNNTWS